MGFITIELASNQSLISIPYNLPDMRVETIFGNYVDDIQNIVGEGESASHFPSIGWAGSLQEIDPTKSYWVNLKPSVDVSGNNPYTLTIDVGSVNNFMGYDYPYDYTSIFNNFTSFPIHPNDIPVDINTLSSLCGNIESIIGMGSSAFCIGDFIVGSLTTLKSLAGYTINWSSFPSTYPDGTSVDQSNFNWNKYFNLTSHELLSGEHELPDVCVGELADFISFEGNCQDFAMTNHACDAVPYCQTIMIPPSGVDVSLSGCYGINNSPHATLDGSDVRLDLDPGSYHITFRNIFEYYNFDIPQTSNEFWESLFDISLPHSDVVIFGPDGQFEELPPLDNHDLEINYGYVEQYPLPYTTLAYTNTNYYAFQVSLSLGASITIPYQILNQVVQIMPDNIVGEIIYDISSTGCTGIINESPVTDSDIYYNVNEDESIIIDLSNHCNDPDGDTLSYNIVSGPYYGTYTQNNQYITYVPSENYHGDDNFQYECSDGISDSSYGIIHIEVLSVIDEPYWLGITQNTPTTMDCSIYNPAECSNLTHPTGGYGYCTYDFNDDCCHLQYDNQGNFGNCGYHSVTIIDGSDFIGNNYVRGTEDIPITIDLYRLIDFNDIVPPPSSEITFECISNQPSRVSCSVSDSVITLINPTPNQPVNDDVNITVSAVYGSYDLGEYLFYVSLWNDYADLPTLNLGDNDIVTNIEEGAQNKLHTFTISDTDNLLPSNLNENITCNSSNISVVQECSYIAVDVNKYISYKPSYYADGNFGTSTLTVSLNYENISLSDSFNVTIEEVTGCMDSSACNYNNIVNSDDGNCLQFDCANICGGTATEDCYGICGGSNYSSDVGCGCIGPEAGHNGDPEWCLDCTDSAWGEAVFDDCNVCSGGTSGHTANSDKDCAGVCNGPGIVGTSSDNIILTPMVITGQTHANWPFFPTNCCDSGITVTCCRDGSGNGICDEENVYTFCDNCPDTVGYNFTGFAADTPYNWIEVIGTDVDVFGCMDNTALNYNLEATSDYCDDGLTICDNDEDCNGLDSDSYSLQCNYSCNYLQGEFVISSNNVSTFGVSNNIFSFQPSGEDTRNQFTLNIRSEFSEACYIRWSDYRLYNNLTYTYPTDDDKVTIKTMSAGCRDNYSSTGECITYTINGISCVLYGSGN